MKWWVGGWSQICVAGLPQPAVGSSIVISEDFPRDVMLRRGHLIKFAKQVCVGDVPAAGPETASVSTGAQAGPTC